jgi:glycosyltransferase involved in cell wall biosynthesis
MMDVLFVTHNRLEFTRAALETLLKNTNWGEARLIVYDDDSTDGTREFLLDTAPTDDMRFHRFKGPVAIMNHYLMSCPSDHVFAKVDSDTMVPLGWLEECQDVLRRNPTLDFLGIEAHCPVVAGANIGRTYQKARHIGGIGVFRTRAFRTLPRPQGIGGRFGFTEFQLAMEGKVEIGWIDPAIPVFLLDRLPRSPWQELSKAYVEKGWQRDWPNYQEISSHLWEWFCP